MLTPLWRGVVCLDQLVRKLRNVSSAIVFGMGDLAGVSNGKKAKRSKRRASSQGFLWNGQNYASKMLEDSDFCADILKHDAAGG